MRHREVVLLVPSLAAGCGKALAPATDGIWTTASFLHNGSVPDLVSSERRRIDDTTKPGYGHEGHACGDALNKQDRAAVIQYFKTL